MQFFSHLLHNFTLDIRPNPKVSHEKNDTIEDEEGVKGTNIYSTKTEEVVKKIEKKNFLFFTSAQLAKVHV